ncbi:MAG: hypothetical protein M1821_005119 [Bathelium mastoideum]|nr:MAG: hypothetical protein M1821_005119 [Bathelium mastoideum]
MEGYNKVAHLMGAHNEFAIFRRFQALNMRNLLYMQAEIIHLEADLREIARNDAMHADRVDYPYDWWSLAMGEAEGASEQWNKVLELRGKLEKYNEALLKQSEVSRLGPPTQHDLNFLRNWFERPWMGSFPLLGLDRDAWGPDNEEDLIGLRTREAPDRFSRWFTDTLIPKFHEVFGKRFKSPVSEELGSGLYKYEESTLMAIVFVITVVIASLLPLCSIVILYVVQSDSLRIGIILILSLVCSLTLTLMMNARKIEVFAAASA